MRPASARAIAAKGLISRTAAKAKKRTSPRDASGPELESVLM